MLNLVQDVRFALRTLAKAPGFAAVVVITLALGIGVNTAIFSVINAALFAPPPFAEPHELVRVWRTGTGLEQRTARSQGRFTPELFVQYRQRLRSFESLAAIDFETRTLDLGDEPISISAAAVSPSTIDLLGVKPLLGNGFGNDAGPEAQAVAIISYDLWLTRFGSNPGLIGRPIKLDDQWRTVIAVMPPEFEFVYLWMGADVWYPGSFETARPGLSTFEVIGRLKAGVSAQQAAAEVRLVGTQIEREHSTPGSFDSADIGPLKQISPGDRGAFFFLAASVGLVLMIACANVANLLLSRAVARRQEVAIRLSLGAGRQRIVLQLLTESVLLALLGAVAALLLASWDMDLLSTENLRARLDGRVLAYTFGLSVLAGIGVGLAPALEALRADLTSTLKQGARNAGGPRGRWLRGLLVSSQTACALALSVAAALMVNSFLRLQRIDPGFKTDDLLTLSVSLRQDTYTDARAQADYFEQALARISEVPGVVQATAASEPLINSHGFPYGFYLPGAEDGTVAQRALLARVSPGHFRLLGQPLLSGRYLTERDDESAPAVVIVDQSFARRFFAGADPVGKHITLPTDGGDRATATIIGVVADARPVAYGQRGGPTMYVPYRQMPFRHMHLAVRTTAGNSAALAKVLRQTVRSLDPDQPLSQVVSVDQQLDRFKQRIAPAMLLTGSLAVLGLALASVGIYGVVSYSVAQRTHEVGVRMALGARRSDVLRLVIMTQLKPVVAGLAVGLAAALVMTGALSGSLYGISATDPATFLLVPLLLAAAAFLASYLPARRATRVAPMEALRHE